jgi:hypothetical protein
VKLEQDILDCAQNELNLLSVSGTRIVRVNLLGRCALVEAHKAVEEVVARGVIVRAAMVVREVVFQRRPGQLLRKEIDFIQEEDLQTQGQGGRGVGGLVQDSLSVRKSGEKGRSGKVRNIMRTVDAKQGTAAGAGVWEEIGGGNDTQANDTGRAR